MANGDIQNSISDQFLQQFDRSIGVSGMQKLQQFPALQKLGHAGQLSLLKNDFHGLKDFKAQMKLYSSSSTILKIAWSLISSIVLNNPTIAVLLTNIPGLGMVGQAFQSIHNFGQVFSLSPGDLTSPSTVASKVSIFKDQSTKTSNTVQDASGMTIGGGAGITASGNASRINGILVVGIPLPGYTLQFDGTNLVWKASNVVEIDVGSGGVVILDDGTFSAPNTTFIIDDGTF
jgi:hypothetical protein